MTFWAEAESLLGSQLGSLDEPWASIAVDDLIFEPRCEIAFRIGRERPALILSCRAWGTFEATLASPCCGVEYARLGLRFACTSCRRSFAEEISETRLFFEWDRSRIETLVLEWLEYDLNPLESSIVAPHIAAWIRRVQEWAEDIRAAEVQPDRHFLSKGKLGVELTRSLQKDFTGPLSVLLAHPTLSSL